MVTSHLAEMVTLAMALPLCIQNLYAAGNIGSSSGTVTTPSIAPYLDFQIALNSQYIMMGIV